MSGQLNLARFIKPRANAPKYTSSSSHNSRLCPYCGLFFSPQGLGSHIKTHQSDPNARCVKPSKYCRVEVRDAPQNSMNESRTSGTSPMEDTLKDGELSDTAFNPGDANIADVNNTSNTDDANIAVCADGHPVDCEGSDTEDYADINITASCFKVDLSSSKWLSIHASPRFWKFLFSSQLDQTIEVVDTYDYTKYSATTCVRMAFKQFEMQNFKLNMTNLDPTFGTLASSQKGKLDKMKSWAKNPLKPYECKKQKNKNYYFLVAKDNELVCVDCHSSHVNKACSLVRCKKCCIEYCFQERQMCKCKDHVKGMKERKQKALEDLAEAGILDEVDMEEMIEESAAASE